MDEILMKTLENLKSVVDTENIIGKPIVNGDGTIILPVSKVSYGFVVGGGEYSDTNPKGEASTFPHAEASGGGVTVTPVGFLVCGREKKFLSVEKTSENKWTELLTASINALKPEDK